MKMTIKLCDNLATVLRVNQQRSIVRDGESRAIRQLCDAIASGNRSFATDCFNQAIEWNTLGNTIADTLRLVNKPRSAVYAVDSWYLRDLMLTLTPSKDEHAVYITGPQIEGVRVLSRTCTFDLDEQSLVSAKGNPESCLTALIKILENGNGLHAIAHSHPGSGPSATQQSDTDMIHLRSIQHAGADVIGLIFTRDGFVRFYTYDKPFVVHVTGKGVSHVENNIYKLDPVSEI